MEELITSVTKLMGQRYQSTNIRKWQAWCSMTAAQRRELAIEVIETSQAMKTMKPWSKIPIDIKLEYIQLLDFPDRLRLRRTSRIERALLDSLPVTFTQIEFDSTKGEGFGGGGNFGYVTASYKKANGRDEASKILKIYNGGMYNTAIHFFAYLLKVGRINDLRIFETYSPDRFDGFLEVLEKSAPFKIKKLNITAQKKAVECFLKNAEGLEEITLTADGCKHFPFADYLEVPNVTKAKVLTIGSLYSEEDPLKLVEKWIECNAEVGAKFRASVVSSIFLDIRDSRFLMNYIEKFSDRIVMQNDKKVRAETNTSIQRTIQQVRIQTNNDAKHILLEFISNCSVDPRLFTIVSFSIIRSDLKESEYDKNMQWVLMSQDFFHSSPDSFEWLTPMFDSTMKNEFHEMLKSMRFL